MGNSNSQTKSPTNSSPVTVAANDIANNSSAAEHFDVREAGPEDAGQIRELIQELADFMNMSGDPKIDANQITAHMKEGRVSALVARTVRGEMAAYSMYYFTQSSTFGKYMFLEDLYVKEPYRRSGLGRLLLRELAKIASANDLPFIEWNVTRDNTKAIAFYKKLKGLEDLTSEKRIHCWQLDRENFTNSRLQATTDKKSRSRVALIDIADNNSPYIHFTCFIHSPGEDLEDEFYVQHCDSHVPFPVDFDAAAFYNSRAYSTWHGPHPMIDKICIKTGNSSKDFAIQMLAKAAKIALEMNAAYISWDEPSGDESPVSIYKSLGADDLTESKGWLLFRWHYKKDD